MKTTIKMLLASLFLSMGANVWAVGGTDAEYTAALAAVKDGTYTLSATYNETQYYLKADGTVTSDADEAAVFLLNKVSGGAYKSVGWNISTTGINGFTNWSSGDNSQLRIDNSWAFRADYECQVLFLNAETGKYAIRSTNAGTDNGWGGDFAQNIYWSTNGINAIYYTTGEGAPAYVWTLTEATGMFDRSKTYYIKSAISTWSISKPYMQSQASNAADNYNLVCCASTTNAAKWYLIPGSHYNNFYIYEPATGYYITAGASQGNAWMLSKTPCELKLTANSGSGYSGYTIASTAGAQANNNGNGVITWKNESGEGETWTLEVAEDAVTLPLQNASDGIERLVTTVLSSATVTYSATVTSAGFGTLVVPFDADVSGDVEAWELSGIDGNSRIQGTKITTISANAPVLLKNAGTLNLTAKSGTIAYSSTPTNGLLTGTYTSTTATAGTYVLQNLDSSVAFYKVASGSEPTIKPFRAYLTAPSPARALTFAFDEATGLEATNIGKQTMDGSAIYDLQGRRVVNGAGLTVNGQSSTLKKDLYILNGNKIIIK